MIKLIASDIDGTLIPDSTPNLYPEIVEEIKSLAERGVIFCGASGRQLCSIQNVFREVSDKICYIAENGAHIHDEHGQGICRADYPSAARPGE